MSTALRRLLAHPLTRGLDLDDPRTTELRRRIIQDKALLRRIYEDWYTALLGSLPPGPGRIVEVGAGAGFLKELLPEVLASDVTPIAGVDLVLDAAALPFAEDSLRAIVMTNVLHHLPRARAFFRDAARSVRAGGVLAMIEPWVTAWSRFVYRRLHHEPFDPDAAAWEFPRGGPLSSANSALPWILFRRDHTQFEREFPVWRIERIEPGMPFRYLVSGGVSLRSLSPGFTAAPWRILERLLAPWSDYVAMFALVVLRRTETA